MSSGLKICVLVPSEDALQRAVHIRYLPLVAHLSAVGAELEMKPVGTLGQVSDLTHDVYIVSRCYDTLPLVIAQYLRRSDQLIGVDLLDDYFADEDDSRLARLRWWLSSMVEASDFILCSTSPILQGVAERYAPGLPRHVLTDAYPPFGAKKMTLALNDKISRFRETRRLTLSWVAMDDSPLSPVELADFGAFGEELFCLRSPQTEIHLEILSNGQTMTADNLAAFRRLGLPFAIEEWSAEREAALLSRSLVSFLPVNTQALNVSQSLNRAVTALISGTQVLSAGYPLDGALSPFIYRDAERLRDDLLRGELALNQLNALQFARLAENSAAPRGAATRLMAFLRACKKSAKTPGAAMKRPFAAILHGKHSTISAHKLAQKFAALSVATPFALGEKWNFHLRFVPRPSGAGMDVLISESQVGLLAPDLRKRLVSAGKIIDTSFSRLGLEHVLPDAALDGVAMAAIDGPAALSAAYGPVARLVERGVKALVPGIKCIHSETSHLPWRIAAPGGLVP